MTQPAAAAVSQGWLSAHEWLRVQQTMPITCVDVLPVDQDGRAGLILRDVPEAEPAWCVVGGRLRRAETLEEAVRRELRDTLSVSPVEIPEEPTVVTQYFPKPRPPHLYDPRQHAVSLLFGLQLEGEPIASGEAHDFRWVRPADFDDLSFGFGQRPMIERCLARLVSAQHPDTS